MQDFVAPWPRVEGFKRIGGVEILEGRLKITEFERKVWKYRRMDWKTRFRAEIREKVG